MPKSGERKIFPLFFYFSLSTLSTIGCGDITPITMQARYAVVSESITGQFYLAILVARSRNANEPRCYSPSIQLPRIAVAANELFMKFFGPERPHVANSGRFRRILAIRTSGV